MLFVGIINVAISNLPTTDMNAVLPSAPHHKSVRKPCYPIMCISGEYNKFEGNYNLSMVKILNHRWLKMALQIQERLKMNEV